MRFIGLDCSDVRAIAMVADESGQVVATGERAIHEVADPTDSIQAALSDVADDIHGDATAVVALPQEYRGPVLDLLEPLVDHGVKVWRCSAMEAVAAGALGGGPGVVVHCGLRASAILVGADGRILTAGQAETPLGDEGSALWMAVRAVRLALQGVDGRSPRNERLERSLVAYFGTESFPALIESLEHGGVRASELAGFAAVVLQMATYPDPDPACRVLILQSSRHLIDLVRYALEQGGSPESGVTGSWSGSAMEGPLLEQFLKTATTDVPEVTFRAPSGTPAHGCLRLARACHQLAEEGPAAVLSVVSDRAWQRLFDTK